MNGEELLMQMGTISNIETKKDGKDLLVYHRIWSKDQPIMRMKNFEVFPEEALEDQILGWLDIFWEDMQFLEVDMEEIYEDLKRDGLLDEGQK